MATAERYADELADLVKDNPGVSDGLVRFEQIFDAYMIEARGLRRQAQGAAGRLSGEGARGRIGRADRRQARRRRDGARRFAARFFEAFTSRLKIGV